MPTTPAWQRHARTGPHLRVVGGEDEVLRGPAEEAGEGVDVAAGLVELRRHLVELLHEGRAGIGQRTDQPAPGADVDVLDGGLDAVELASHGGQQLEAGQGVAARAGRGRRRCRPPTARRCARSRRRSP